MQIEIYRQQKPVLINSIQLVKLIFHSQISNLFMLFLKRETYLVSYVAYFIWFIDSIFIVGSPPPLPLILVPYCILIDNSHISCYAFPTPSLLCTNTVIHFQRAGSDGKLILRVGTPWHPTHGEADH